MKQINSMGNKIIVKKIIQIFLIGVILIEWNILKVEAEEPIKGNDYIKEVELTEFGGEPLKEIPVGLAGRMYYTLSIPDSMELKAGDTLYIDLPEQVQAMYNEDIPIYKEKQQVGKIIETGTELEGFEILFTETIPSNVDLVTAPIVFNIRRDTPEKKIKLTFGTNVKKSLVIRPPNTGIGELVENKQRRTASDTEGANSWYADANMLGDYFYAELDIETVKRNNPNFKGQLTQTVTPFYFFGRDQQGTYLEDYIAQGLDFNHTISDTAIHQTTDLQNYIEQDAFEHIIMASQISLLLAQEKGLVIDSKNGSKMPLQFEGSNSDMLEQKSYLFASQVMNWVDTLKYNKFSSSRMSNFEYSDFQTYTDVSGSGRNYQYFNVDPYIAEIEQNIGWFKSSDYLEFTYNSNDEAILTIPQEQRKFRHWIDKDKSENLYLIEGMSDDFFENFEDLTFKVNDNYNGEKIKIVFNKGIFNSTELKSTTISANHMQVKKFLG